jgi:hypothetical protein
LNFILFFGTVIAIKIKKYRPQVDYPAAVSRGDLMLKRLTSRRGNAENTGSALAVLYIKFLGSDEYQ